MSKPMLAFKSTQTVVGKHALIEFASMRILAFLIAFLLPPIGMIHSAPIELRRGISIHEWLNWSRLNKGAPDAASPSPSMQTPSPYAWPPYKKNPAPISSEDLRRIRERGFDFVRLSVDPGPLLSVNGEKRSEALAVLADAVRSILRSDLRVVFDFHPVGQVPAFSAAALETNTDGQLGADFAQVVSETASMLSRLIPDANNRIALELFNEPQFYPCDGAGGRRWQATLERLVKAARVPAPQLTLIVSGACGGNIKGLMHIDPTRLADENLLYSFHYYEDLTFTHQGTKARPWLTSVPWPASRRSLVESLAVSRDRIRANTNLSNAERTKAEEAAKTQLEKYYLEDRGTQTIEAAFARVIQWGRAHSLPSKHLFMGEFGVMRATGRRPGAEDPDRLQWLSFVRQQAEHYGIGWAFWEYSNPHGMSLTLSAKAREFDPIVLDALGLRKYQHLPLSRAVD